MKVISFEQSTGDLSARTKARYDLNDDPCALVKVRLANPNADFVASTIIGNVEFYTSEYWVYMSKGAKKLTVRLPGYLPLDVTFADYEINRLEKLTTYTLTIEIPTILVQQSLQPNSTSIKKTCGYVDLGAQVGSMMSVSMSIGGYIHNVNIEVDGQYGLTKSEQIYWNDDATSTSPTCYTYKPMYFGGRIGYGIIIGKSMRLTPQIGMGVSMIKGQEINKGSITNVDKTYAANASVGLRFNYAFCSWIGIALTPEYSFAVKKGKVFEALAPVSSKVKGFGEGFNCRIGINFLF